MNQAAELTTGSLLKKNFITFLVGGKAYTARYPSLKTICRIIYALSGMSFQDNEKTFSSAISQIPENYLPMLKGVAVAIAGGGTLAGVRAFFLYQRFKRSEITADELKDASEAVIGLTLGSAQPFFDAATSLKSVVGMVAKPK